MHLKRFVTGLFAGWKPWHARTHGTAEGVSASCQQPDLLVLRRQRCEQLLQLCAKLQALKLSWVALHMQQVHLVRDAMMHREGGGAGNARCCVAFAVLAGVCRALCALQGQP